MHTSTHQGRPSSSVPRVTFSNTNLPTFPTRTTPVPPHHPSENTPSSALPNVNLQALEDDDEVLLQRLSLDDTSNLLSTYRHSHPTSANSSTARTPAATTYHHPSLPAALPQQQLSHQRQPELHHPEQHYTSTPLPSSSTSTAPDSHPNHGITTALPRYSERPVLAQRSSWQARESDFHPHGHDSSSFTEDVARGKILSQQPSPDSSRYFPSSVQAIMKQASPDGPQQNRRASLSGGARRVSVHSSSPSPPPQQLHGRQRSEHVSGLQYGQNRSSESRSHDDRSQAGEQENGSEYDEEVENAHSRRHPSDQQETFEESDRLDAPHVGIAELQAQLRKYQQAAAGVPLDVFAHDDAENCDSLATSRAGHDGIRSGVAGGQTAKSGGAQARAGSAQPSRGGEGKASQPMSVLQQLQQRASNTAGRAWRDEDHEVPVTRTLKPRPLSARPACADHRQPAPSSVPTSSYGTRGVPQLPQFGVQSGGSRYPAANHEAWQDEQRAPRSPTSPRGSVASMARSTMSTFSSKQPNGIKKVDR